MQSVFEALWNGNLLPYKDCGAGDPEVEELAELIHRNKLKVEGALNDQQKDLLKNYIACQEEHSYLMIVHAFRDGFSLACKLLSAALGEK